MFAFCHRAVSASDAMSTGAVCHKDVRAVKDSAIVLRADRVETLDAEPTALVPEKKKAFSLFTVESNFFSILFYYFSLLASNY